MALKKGCKIARPRFHHREVRKTKGGKKVTGTTFLGDDTEQTQGSAKIPSNISPPEFSEIFFFWKKGEIITVTRNDRPEAIFASGQTCNNRPVPFHSYSYGFVSAIFVWFCFFYHHDFGLSPNPPWRVGPNPPIYHAWQRVSTVVACVTHFLDLDLGAELTPQPTPQTKALDEYIQNM